MGPLRGIVCQAAANNDCGCICALCILLPDEGPDGHPRGVGKILDAALRYKKEYKRVPVLFVDGVDLLAVCDHLITLAKVMANSNEMKIIL